MKAPYLNANYKAVKSIPARSEGVALYYKADYVVHAIAEEYWTPNILIVKTSGTKTNPHMNERRSTEHLVGGGGCTYSSGTIIIVVYA